MPQLFTNNARALLASGITNVATSLTVEAAKADLFPTADTGTGAVPAATNWFKLTLQDVDGNVEIVYVRTRTAGSGVMSNLLRGQEGTTARAFSAGTVAGLRITAADVEESIAAANNSVQLTGSQTVEGVKTFSSQIVANGGVAGSGSSFSSVVVGGSGAAVTPLDVQTTGANALTSTFTSGQSDPNFRIGAMNGVAGSTGVSQGLLGLFYLGQGEASTIDFRRGATALDGSLAFRTNGADRFTISNLGTLASAKTSGVDSNAAFYGVTSGGTFAAMWSRRGAPFSAYGATTGSQYAPSLTHQYLHNSGYNGVYSVGVTNQNLASAGYFAVHHINETGGDAYIWRFQGGDGGFVSPGNITAYSDARLKTDLVKIGDALAKVKQLNGYTYTRIDSGERQTGVVAQEVREVLPEAVTDTGDTLAVAYGNMVGLLIEAIKEQSSVIESLVARIESLEVR